LPWIIVAGLILALAAQYWMANRPAVSDARQATNDQRLFRFRLAPPEGVSVIQGRSPALAISPQDDQIVFQGMANGVSQLYRQSLNALEATAIAGTTGATDAAFSPDGRTLAFFADGNLQRIPVDGGIASPLAEAANPRGLTWGSDDNIYLSPRNNSPISRVPARGGKLETVTSLADGELSHRWPQLSADGAALIYTVWNDTGWDEARVIWHPLDGSPARELVKGGGFARHIARADGLQMLVYVHDRTVMSAPVERAAGITIGRAEPRLDQLFSNLSGGAHLAISPRGSMVYLGGRGTTAPRDLLWVDRAGKHERVSTLPATARLQELSPDERHLAYYKVDGGTRELWIDDLRARTSKRFAGPEPAAASPMLITPSAIAWSPKGDAVTFASGNPTNLYRVPLARPEAVERLTNNTYPQAPGSWSPDGNTLAFEERDPLSGSDIWLTTLDDQHRWTTRPFLRTPFSEVTPVISPDGRWIAYSSNESGRFETYAQPFPSGGRAVQISTNGGAYPKWSPSSREVVFVEVYGPGGFAAVPFHDGQAAVDRTQHLPGSRSSDRAYAVSSDGRRLLIAVDQTQTPIPTDIVVVVNWIGELIAPGRPQ
jgi:Tol biopolymer transport system component